MSFRRIMVSFGNSVFVALVLGLTGFVLLTSDARSAGLGDLRLGYMQGDVQVRTADTQDWVAAAVNIPLAGGDNIWSPERAVAEVQAVNGTCVRIAENTSLNIITFDRKTAQFSLDQGNAYVNSRGRKDQLFQLDTPSASVRVIGKAIFEVDVSTDGYADVSVLSGTLSVESESGALTVSQGQVLSIGQDGQPRLFALSPPDDWTRWNQDRDRTIYQQRASARYLPPELQTYSYDLDQNGQWTNVPEYGYVWRPTVVVGPGWSPYRTGRWCWMGGDYVWVPDESWGWAPYHYGRWALIGSLGWCWVPPPPKAVYWAPAYVGWVRTPDHVAWVPLAPGEVYYGRGYHGPHSVNITNININTVVINKPYRNSTVHDGVVAASRETFLTGRGEHVRLKENPFATHKPVVGPPAIKPERQTLMPSLKTIPRTERPPEHLTTVIPRGMEKPLPAQRRLDRSVLRPTQPQQQMPVQKPEEPRAPGMRQKAERGSQPVPERGPSVERPLRQGPPVARPEPGPVPAKPPESAQKPAQPGGASGTPRQVTPVPVTPGPAAPEVERRRPGLPPVQPQTGPKTAAPETRQQPARPEAAPPIARPERPTGPTRPEVQAPSPKPASPPPVRPAGPETPGAATRPPASEVRPAVPARPQIPEVRPAAPQAPPRPQTPEVRPAAPQAPPRPQTPEARPLAPPSPPPAPSRPPQAQPPAPPREQAHQPPPQARPAAPPASPPAARPPQPVPPAVQKGEAHPPAAEQRQPPRENEPGPQQQHREGR